MPPKGTSRREPADYSGRNTQQVIGSLAPDAGLFGTGSFGPAPELSAAVSTSPITQAQQKAFNASIAPIVAKNTVINTQNDTVYAGGNNTFDETAGGVSFKSNITPVATTPVTEPTPDILAGANPYQLSIPTPEERAGYAAQAAKAAATKVEATAQAAKDKEVQDYLANPGPLPTGTETLDRFIAGIGPSSLITLGEIQASPAYANMSLSQQKAIVDSSNANSINTKQSAAAQEAKDFWATQDYDPNKYKVAPDASFGEKITGLSRVSDSIFQSIASGNVPKGALGAYAGMAQLGDNPMPSIGEIGKGVLAGGVGVGGGGGGGSLAGSSPITQYMAQSSIPPYLNIPNSSSSAAAGLVGHDDTNRVYMNTGEDLNKKYPNMAGKGKWIIPEGGGTVGAYDIQFVHDAYDPRAGGAGLFNDYLMPVASAVMGFYNPAFAVSQVATKAAAGETLHLGDYASAITNGLKASGMLTAPTKAVAATATTPAVAASAGNGLLGFDYATSVKGLNTAFAVADGDIIGGVVSQFGDVLTEKALNTVGLNKTVLDGLNINQDDLVQGMLTTEKELLKGASLDDALLKGVGKYIVEGGSLSLGTGGIQTPEFIKAIGNAVKDVGSAIDDAVLQPIKQTMPAVEDAVRAAGSAIDDAAQPLIQVAKDVADPIVEAGSAINREVVKPTIQAVEAVGKPVEQGIRAVNEAVVAPTVQAAIDAGSAVNREAVKPVVDVIEDVLGSTYDAINQLDNFIDDIDLPSFNLPNFNLPNFNLPNFNFGGGSGGSLGLSMSGGQPAQRASLMPKKDLDEIDLGFELEELERVKQFDRPQYKTQGIYGI